MELPVSQGDREKSGAAEGPALISAELAESFSFAAWQNSIPLLRRLEVTNPTSATLENVELRFVAQPAFARPKSWRLDRLPPGGSLEIRQRDLQLDPDYLAGLNEAERAVVGFTLCKEGEPLAEETFAVRMLARDEWGGMGDRGDLLAAFVMPNDPAVAKIMKRASEVLHQHGHASSLDGYQSGDPRRAYLLTAAVWSAVAAEGLAYAHPPASFEEVGQKTRRPSTVLKEGLATCLDSTLLFAAAIEAIGLHPVVVMQQGHCFAGAWLVDQNLNHRVETIASEVRKAIVAKELLVFETTLITQKPPATFDAAIDAAQTSLQERYEGNFVAALDIARARSARILPLASHEPGTPTEGEEPRSNGPLPLPAAPRFDGMPGAAGEEMPTTPDGRIERWQRKLLDLSLRNRLLNFKNTKQTIPFLCPDVPALEDRLASGRQIRIISHPKEGLVMGRDEEVHHQRTKEDAASEFARAALDRNELASTLNENDLQARLTQLYRQVNNDLAEGGTNTLFLAIGFLKWKRKPDDAVAYRAPLLLVPVKLTRRSALSPYHLKHHEDEVRFNATLIQMLKQDFARDLSYFESDLPTDEHGVDVPQVLQRMRREVRDMPGLEVVDETALSTFSFAKYLMWKDLVDRLDQLQNNRVVKHLVCDPDKAFSPACETPLPEGEQIDTRYTPKELIHPLPADSSQLAAVMAAAEGHDFVLIGPPGTGKSQTIANMIAQCLAHRKTVLFVAEKTAALDVVHRRLKQHGLGDFCLELHSHKAERRKLLDQLQNSWEHGRRPTESEWITVSDHLRVRRDELNAYVAALHEADPSGWTVFRAMGLSVRKQHLAPPELGWPSTLHLDEAGYRNLQKIVEELALTYRVIQPGVDLRAVDAEEWSLGWENQLLAAANQLEVAATTLQAAMKDFFRQMGVERSDGSLEELQQLEELARTLVASAGEDYRVVYHKQLAALPAAIDQLEASIAALHAAKENTQAEYDVNSLGDLPLEDLELQWRTAKSRWWPLSLLAKSQVRKLLQTYAESGKADPERDLPQLKAMGGAMSAIGESMAAGHTPYWQGHETDCQALRAHISHALQARRAVLNVGKMAPSLGEFSKRIAPLLTQQEEADQTQARFAPLLDAMKNFVTSVSDYKAAAARLPFERDCPHALEASVATAGRIRTHRRELQRWTAWCGIKKRAIGQGLEALVRDLEAGRIEASQLPDLFELAFVRWWLPRAIDRSDVLRGFQKFRHEAAIEDFRRIDELARQAASLRVRESLLHDLPSPDKVPRKSELGLLRHQMQLKRPSKTIREVLTAMPDTFSTLAPCVLMSPLSIAQYLPADRPPFDVVIFDEASQITTWDAIGAIARGRQTIIVGDPKQLPPTNFFGRSDDEEEEQLEDYERDLESILDEASASGLPTVRLDWHYRSRHESLIAFSNWHYYGNRLVTFPSAVTTDRAVSLKHFPRGIYDRGKSRTNRTEADAIVADATQRMRQWLDLPAAERPTLGIVTFNLQQQTLIQDLLDQARRDDPELEWYFDDARVEPTVVKNLENVQGDERDVMFFSITFGRDQAGKFDKNFGAINRDGGERRLNVAVTRSRQELVVYSSFKADELNVEGLKGIGVRDLKCFLDYAERGPIALAAELQGSMGGFDSPFEEAVAAALEERGWRLVSQVGVSGFRIDLGVVHPDREGVFLAGVECDGATYHRSATARDRDVIREQVLNHLGWTLVRIWSPDWWYDSKRAAEQVHEALEELLAESRTSEPGGPPTYPPTRRGIVNE